MRISSLLVATGTLIAACGGDTLTTDTGDGGGKDGSSQDGASADGSGGGDSGGGQDGGGGTDAGGNCTPPNQPCARPCPQGTVCLIASGPTLMELGCTPIPPSCTNGQATCDCMSPCFCPKSNPMNKCMATTGGLTCSNGAISRREFKKDINYVSHAQRDELADDALAIPLATYRYKTEAADGKKHLGFIIDDQPESSPAVQADRTHVDEYGYTTMLLATVQRQQEQIDAMNKKLDALEKKRCP